MIAAAISACKLIMLTTMLTLLLSYHTVHTLDLDPVQISSDVSSSAQVQRLETDSVSELIVSGKNVPSYLKHLQQWSREKREARNPWWKSILQFGKEKHEKGVPESLLIEPESNRRTGGRPAKLAAGKGQPGTTLSQRPPIEEPPVSPLSKMLGGLLPNTYFSKPRFRYPYYDRAGKGYLLYGYGEKDLYEYSVFKPLEGYY